MEVSSQEKELKRLPSDQIEGRLLKVSFLNFGRVVVSLPLFSLIFCFVTALIFKFDEVNKTVCNVQNTIPSISAITGVAPQRYVWRICIALHSTPRFAVGYVYYNWYCSKEHMIAEKHRKLFRRLLSVNFWLYTVENACLVGVTYISNVENYPLHEKIFVVFMITALCYEFLTIVLFKWTHPRMAPEDQQSYKFKKICFTIIMLFTGGLIFFFLRHRLYCETGAFTWFSFCEYGIAITNICFHYSATIDFRGRHWFAGLPVGGSTNHHKTS